jgi:hypothetical protein
MYWFKKQLLKEKRIMLDTSSPSWIRPCMACSVLLESMTLLHLILTMRSVTVRVWSAASKFTIIIVSNLIF